MPTWMIIASGMTGLACYYIFMALLRAADQRKLKRLETTLAAAGFAWTQRVVGTDGSTGIGVNDANNTICLASMGRDGDTAVAFPVKSVLAAEVFEDGESIIRSSRVSQAAGAAIGGLVFGGAGAVVGALSGSKTSSTHARQLDLRLLVDDVSNPNFDVRFLAFPMSKKRREYADASKSVRHWQGVIKVMMERVRD